MAIQIFSTQDEADAVAGPKHVWHDVDRWVVYTGADIPAPSRVLSIQVFRNRFTDPELAGIVASANASVRVLLLKLTTRLEVDLNDPQVIGGMALLVSQGLLTAARRDAILA